MRAVLLIGLAGCLGPPSDPPAQPTVPDPPPPSMCQDDAVCSPKLCGRDWACHPASELHAAHVNWTIVGMPASATTCNPARQLAVAFKGPGRLYLEYAPVPCVEGRFTIDKLPISYDAAWLGDRGKPPQYSPLDPTTGEVTIDLGP
jgi:hypothetical protein